MAAGLPKVEDQVVQSSSIHLSSNSLFNSSCLKAPFQVGFKSSTLSNGRGRNAMPVPRGVRTKEGFSQSL